MQHLSYGKASGRGEANRAAARKLGVKESMARRWRCEELTRLLAFFCRFSAVLQALFVKIHLFPVIKTKKLFLCIILLCKYVTTWTPAARLPAV